MCIKYALKHWNILYSRRRTNYFYVVENLLTELNDIIYIICKRNVFESAVGINYIVRFSAWVEFLMIFENILQKVKTS